MFVRVRFSWVNVDLDLVKGIRQSEDMKTIENKGMLRSFSFSLSVPFSIAFSVPFSIAFSVPFSIAFSIHGLSVLPFQ